MSDYLRLLLHGSHYAMGRQHGQQVRVLRPGIAKAISARISQIEQNAPDDRFETLFCETRGLLEANDDSLLAMIRGQAEALEFEFEALLRYALVTYLYDDLIIRRVVGNEGCTTWAASGSATADSADGTSGPILAKTRDYPRAHLPLQVVVRATPEVGYAYLYVSSAGSPGVFSAGINQAGLVVADTHVCSNDLGPGLPDYSLMMHILEDHDRVSSALDYLCSVPRMGRNNLILADARGHLAVFEIGHRTYGLFETHDGVLVNTNHFASPELLHSFVDPSEPSLKGNSFRRHDLVTAEVNNALRLIDVPFAQRLLATHAGALASICRHPRPGRHPAAGRKSSTISASIFLPARRTMLFCHGPPCQGRYDEFVL